MTLHNHWNFELLDHHCEPGGGVSETVPNDAYSLRDLVDRHVRGMRIDDQLRRGSFDEGDFDSDDVEKLRDADLYEREVRRGELELAIEAAKSRVARKRKKDETSSSSSGSASPPGEGAPQGQGDARGAKPGGSKGDQETQSGQGARSGADGDAPGPA